MQGQGLKFWDDPHVFHSTLKPFLFLIYRRQLLKKLKHFAQIKSLNSLARPEEGVKMRVREGEQGVWGEEDKVGEGGRV